MKSTFIINAMFLGILCFASCDRPKCNNNNPIFENYQPNSKVYKDELIKQLNVIDHKELSYWFHKYENINNTESLYFNIQGEELCAILHISVNNWKNLENIRQNEGKGYRGAEFINLKFSIAQDISSTKFIYSSFDRIID